MIARSPDLDLTFRRERRAALSRSTSEVGIDFIEVDSSNRWAGRVRLLVHFVPSAEGVERRVVPENVTPANLRIVGGAGMTDPQLQVEAVYPPPAGGDVLTVDLVLGEIDGAVEARTFGLELVDLPNVDRFFAWAPFSLGWDLPEAIQTGGPDTGAPQPRQAPEQANYLAKDFASFRRLMFDQLSVLVPSWTERNPADMGTALVELLAYAADQLSYYQDAVATEAYLRTARRRVSIARHARLVGYRLHEGCNARLWAQVLVAADAVWLPAGTQLVSGIADEPLLPPGSALLEEAINRNAAFFETMYPVELFAEQNDMRLYAWGARSWHVRRGSTSATLRGHLRTLRRGDVLMFEEIVSPHTGDPADAATPHRHAVRLSAAPHLTVDPLYDQPITEIQWLADDALPFDLCAATTDADGQVVDATVVRGNIVLADHGRTVPDEELPPVPLSGRYRPTLRRTDVVFAVPYDAEAARSRPAGESIRQDPAEALAAVHVHTYDPGSPDIRTRWEPTLDLTRSGRFARDFVVEVDDYGRATLVFGDGVLGRRPTYGRRLVATYRVGNGPAGNVDADDLFHVVTDDPRILGARNFLPGRGGTAAESVERARVYAPQFVHRQESCVTAEDYAAAAERLPGVRRAVARLRWTGSWHAVEVYAQRAGGRAADQEFLDDVRAALEPLALAGHDVHVRAPLYVPLDIAFTVHLEPGTPREVARQALLAAFCNGELPDGSRGFFHPDELTFGQPVYLSQLVARAMRVPGVTAIDWTDGGRLQRWGRPSRGELLAGQVVVGQVEIAQVVNDPLAPELGTISFNLRGGRQ
jgi:hypothetical protein